MNNENKTTYKSDAMWYGWLDFTMRHDYNAFCAVWPTGVSTSSHWTFGTTYFAPNCF